MASFRLKMERGLRARGLEVTHDLLQGADAVLLIGGSRHILQLWQARRRNNRLVQRLDGLNWIQRARWTGARYHLRAVYGNAIMALVRGKLASRLVYQSEFVRHWWENWYGPTHLPFKVILNGVDLHEFSPQAGEASHKRVKRLLIVEGSLSGGQRDGLLNGIRLAEALNMREPVEVVVAGTVDKATQLLARRGSHVAVQFLGVTRREEIPALMNTADLLFSAEVNPPCPNSVIEALACGLPVVGFDTGSLRELVTGDAGRLAPYEGDPWRLEPPELARLVDGALEILNEPGRFRRASRARAEAAFSVEQMVESYLKVLLEP